MKVGSVLWLGVTALLLAACSSGATQTTISEIKPKMKVEQVEALLGQPSHIDESETTGLKGEVYYYPGSQGMGRVIFLNDVVFQAIFTPGGRST